MDRTIADLGHGAAGAGCSAGDGTCSAQLRPGALEFLDDRRTRGDPDSLVRVAAPRPIVAAAGPAGHGSRADVGGAHRARLSRRARAAAARCHHVRPLPGPGDGGAAAEQSGPAEARRRGEGADHPVLRRARLHHHLRTHASRSAALDTSGQPHSDAAVQLRARGERRDRQVYRRLHHGILERATG